MRRRLQLALPLAIAAAALTAVPAGAAGRLGLTEAAGGRFPKLAFVLTLPSPRPLSASDVRVRENGRGVNGVTVVPAATASGKQFGVVLVIDASNSMSGKPVAAALEAAQQFVSHRTPAQQVAVVAFNDETKVVLPFTADSSAIVQALAHRPDLAYGTHLYDAVGEGVELLKEAGITAGSVVVLSDGGDTGSEATRDDVVAAAKATHTRIFAIGLSSRDFAPGAPRSLATPGGFSEATSPAALTRIYDQLGARLAHDYLLRYRSLQKLGAKVTVAVSVKGVAGAARAGYAAPTLPVPPPASSYSKGLGNSFWASPLTMIVFSVFTIGLFAFCIRVLLLPRRRSFQRRLSEFVTLAQASDGGTVGDLTPTSSAEDERPVERSRWWTRFVEEVELADIKLAPTRIATWTLLGMVAVMWLAAVVFGFLGAALGFFVPVFVWMMIRRKVDRKRALFAEQLPDNLAVLASALRAGHSFVGALSVVVDDAPEPAQSEFRRVVAEEQLGRPLEDALDLIVERMKNKDLAQVALVAALQRETGGSTAEVLDRVVETVRERQELRRLISTLTAAGRMSRWVVSLLPVVLIIVITLINPGYLDPLFAHSSGRLLVALAAVLVISGSLVIKRIIDIEV